MMRRTDTNIRVSWIAGIAVLLAGGVLAANWLLPVFVNTQKMRSLAASRISQAYPGDMTFGKITPALLPWPHAVVSQVYLSEGDRIRLHVPQIAIYPKIWPLLTGRLQIDRVRLMAPRAMVELGEAGGATSQGHAHQIGGIKVPEALRALAAAIGPWGDMAVETVDGRLELKPSGRTTAVVVTLGSRIHTADRSVHVRINGKTDGAEGFRLTAQMDLLTGHGGGHLAISGLQSRILQAIGITALQEDLLETALDLDLEANIYGFERLHARFAASASRGVLIVKGRRMVLEGLALNGRAALTPQWAHIALHRLQTTSPAMHWSGSFDWHKAPSRATPPIQLSLHGADLQVAPIRKALLDLFHDQPAVVDVLDIVRDGLVPSVTARLSAPTWPALADMDRLRVEGRLTEGRIVVPGNLFDLEQVRGRVVIENGRLAATGVEARQGNTVARHGGLTLGLYDGSRAFSLDALIEADAGDIPVMLKRVMGDPESAATLDRIPPVAGRVSGRLTVGDRLDRLSTSVTAEAGLTTGSSAFDLVGGVRIMAGEPPRVGLFVKGRMGPATLSRLWAMGGLPPEMQPKAPFGVEGADIAWDASGKWRFNGIVAWDDGPFLGAVAHGSKDAWRVHRLRIKDNASDALMSLVGQRTGRMTDARFTGHIEKSTLDRLWTDHRVKSGAIQGRARLHFDRTDGNLTGMDGELTITDFEYPFTELGSILLLKASIGGQGRRINLPEALVAWDESTFSLAGGALLSPTAVDVKGKIVADRWNTGKLLAVLDREKANQSETPGTGMPAGHPLRGTVSVEIGELIHDRYRIAPLLATVDIGAHQTSVDIIDAQLCGVQMPGQLLFADGAVQMDLSPRASQAALQDVGKCLLERRSSERLAGTLDLDGRLTSRGTRRDELINNLKGELNFSIEDGRISNLGSAGFFTNLLSYLSIHQYVEGDLPDMRKNDFAYRRIDSKWTLGDGHVRIREGVLKSNSVNMVADGKFHIPSRKVDLLVLVSPLTTVDWIVDRIPIVGDILQGTLVAIPVRVKGPYSDPAVLPLSPKAVGSRLGGILKRTVKTPVRIIEPLLKDRQKQPSDQDADPDKR